MVIYQKIIVIILFMGLIISPAVAAIVTSDATPTSIFKCGESTISVSLDDGGITAVDAYLVSTKAVVPMVVGSGRTVPEMQNTTLPLVWNGTYWVGTFGDDSTLLWGTRSISYGATNGGKTIYPSSSSVFVYSDACVGTGVNNYTQMPSGLGKYTSKLFTNQFDFVGTSMETSIIGWAIYPYIEIWGSLFYLILVFTITTVIYLKTQNITQPIAVGVFLLLIFASTAVIDPAYRNYILFILGVGITALYYRVFVRE